MSPLAESIVLGPMDEARRLWAATLALEPRAGEDVVALCELLDLGLRTAEILVIQRLQPVKERFPATIGLQLEIPEPEVDAYRDAVTVPKALWFGDVVDLLSAEELECVGPRLHRGWEDRRFACRRSRRTAQDALGLALDATDQQRLLLLAAYRNRIFRFSPPVRLSPAAILDGFTALRRVVETLLAPTAD